MSFIPFFDVSALTLVLYTLITTHITIVAITVFLHRHQTHKSLTLHPVISHFFRFWLWFATGMVTKEWVAVHRKHHAKCETNQDPHSPVFQGVWNILFLGVIPYRKESQCLDTLEVYGKGTPDDWLERHVYQKHNLTGIFLLLALQLVAFGWPAILIWATQMAWTPFWAAGVINGVGHWFGYRNFACNDNSRNLVPWGVVIGGEELHNNHHAFPRSAKLSFKRGEFDIGWMYIRILECLSLAKVLERSPKCEPVTGRFSLSTMAETFSVKMRSLHFYDSMVMRPTVIAECDRGILNKCFSSLYGKFSNWWLLDSSLLTKEANQYVKEVLSKKEVLAKLYELRVCLIESWHGVGFSTQERLKLLETWCNKAESLGISRLNAFVDYLRGKLLTKDSV